MGFIFALFAYNGSFGQIWIKVAERSIRLENFHFGARFTSYGVPFCPFGYKKDFWHNLIKFIVYRVSLSSSRSHKKPFQLVDLVTGHL